MAESVDALVSNTSGFTSIPVRPRVWVQRKELSICKSNIWLLSFCIYVPELFPSILFKKNILLRYKYRKLTVFVFKDLWVAGCRFYNVHYSYERYYDVHFIMLYIELKRIIKFCSGQSSFYFSAIKGVNQTFERFTPFSHPKRKAVFVCY